MSTDTSTEHKNENLTITCKEEPGSRMVLNIVVSPKATAAAYSKAVKLVNKEISLPGFRKGKAPENYVVQKFGKQIEQEWKQIVLETAFSEALSLLKINPFRNDGIKCTSFHDISKEKGTSFTIEFEAPPRVPHIEINKLSIPDDHAPEVSPKEIEEILENLQYHYAKWEDVTDRPIQKGDFVDLDIDKVEEPQEVICRGERFAVTDDKMAQWMRNLLIGMKVDESKEGVSEKDEVEVANEEEARAFRPTRCKVTVKAIHQPVLPDLNDELAVKVGLPNMEALKERIQKDLSLRNQRELKERKHSQIDDWLINTYRFDIPASLIEEEAGNRLEEVMTWYKNQGMSDEEMAQKKTEFEKNVRGKVEEGFRLFFLLLTFAREHHLTVNTEEVAMELSRRYMQNPNAQLPQNLDDLKGRVSQQIMMQKARDHILDHLSPDHKHSGEKHCCDNHS